MATYILALDQGTTSSRAIGFSPEGEMLATDQQEFAQHFPEPGWVEHDAKDLIDTTIACARAVIEKLGRPVAIGITNQRETTVLWDRKTGEPVAPAIVWQDRRTAETCATLKQAGHEAVVQQKTGLLLDPYFSATKLAWLLDSDPDLRLRANAGELAFGTVESWLVWKLSGGRHVSDVTNASRTLMLNISKLTWDEDLLDLFNIPTEILPEVCDNAGSIAVTAGDLLPAGIPIAGLAGDQQAASIGQGCLDQGMTKSTYGTGCFLLQNLGASRHASTNRLLETVALRLGERVDYAMEGSIFSAGSTIQWLRDGLGIIDNAAQSGQLAASLNDNAGVYLVPAFAGLGAPHWDSGARGLIAGLTRDSSKATLCRAALEAVAYQTRDLLTSIERDTGRRLTSLRVDGGMVANDWMLQFMADILDRPVERPQCIETTALGAAFLAGLGVGMFDGVDDIRSFWQLDRRFEPTMAQDQRERLLAGWDAAVSRALSA